MRELENDQYVRQTNGYLPEASVAFIDEIFKANSAILNTLLTILNERLFDNGSERHPVPLVCMVNSSSFLPPIFPSIFSQRSSTCVLKQFSIHEMKMTIFTVTFWQGKNLITPKANITSFRRVSPQ